MRCLTLFLTLLACGCQPHRAPSTQPLSQSAPKLVAGLGPVHHPVCTANTDAQRYFDQGLAYLYGFNHEAAVRSFEYAGRLDPNLAMAYWGKALALGPNINAPEIDREAAKAAYEAVRRAEELASHATVPEREYIAALSKRYAANPAADLRKLANDYKVAMGELSRRYPNDLDAATLYAESAMDLRPWKLYTHAEQPEEGTEEIVKTLEWVLARDPNHLGANHYYIHATEASATPERALPCGRRLPKLAPASGHLVHMPAHVYIRLGDYTAAIAANEAAAKADENYVSCCAPGGGFYPALYYSHNLHFLAVAAAMAGHSKAASDAAARLAAHIDPVVEQMPMFEGFGAVPLLVATRQAQWGQVIKWPQPKDNRHATLAAWHFARGMAHASMKDIGPALQEHDAFAAEIGKAKDLPFGNNSTGQVLAVADHLLSGRIFAARGDNDAARRELELAVAAQDQLDYDEPPPFPWPVREALGAHLLRTGDPVAAEKVFREDLAKNPNNPRSLFGLAEALRARGRYADSDEARKQFQQHWSSADFKLALDDF